MNATSSFVPALELCRAFHDELIAPQLQTAFPRLRYSTALLGTGSEILGFDTERSTDHHWGPRLQVFLSPNDLAKYADAITALFARTLPRSFRGYPTISRTPVEVRSTRPRVKEATHELAMVSVWSGGLRAAHTALRLQLDHRDLPPSLSLVPLVAGVHAVQ